MNKSKVSNKRLHTAKFELKEQEVRDLFFGDKFAKEAYKYNYSKTVFSVIETAVKYFRKTKAKQGKLEL